MSTGILQIERSPVVSYHIWGWGRLYKQSIELSGSIPKGGALPGRQDGGSMEFDAGSTFSQSSIRSAQPSQFIWNLVTRGFDARIFLWSWKEEDGNIDKYRQIVS